MASDLAVSVRDLQKTYRIASARQGQMRLGEALAARARHPLRRTKRELFDALRGVTFDVREGEAIGIIGRNGAGKSTLLKILSRITTPTGGRIELYGRVGSLLEVGTGFHPELTGRENIYLNGAILGMGRREIDGHFDSIVDFAEVHTFLDTPVKRYSSGMYVRLAFAVAAHLEPEILIVDEVLAVGDAAFQKKCLRRMEEASSKDGRTILFVSHNMTAVESFCKRGIYLERGEIAYDGDMRTTVDRYLSSGVAALESSQGEFDLCGVERGSDVARPVFRKVTVRDGRGRVTNTVRMGEPLTLTIDLDGDYIRNHGIDVRIVNEADRPVVNLHSHMKALEIFDSKKGWEQVELTIPELPLVGGRYWVELQVREGSNVVGRKVTLDRVSRAATFEVQEADVYGTGFRLGTGTDAGVVFLDQRWEVRSNGSVVAATEAPVERARRGAACGSEEIERTMSLEEERALDLPLTPPAPQESPSGDSNLAVEAVRLARSAVAASVNAISAVARALGRRIGGETDAQQE
jgi:lipopolysaccharide transport system ATP-binding protein